MKLLERTYSFLMLRPLTIVYAGNGDDANIVVLTEVLGKLGDGFCGHVADGLSAFKSKKLAVLATRFHNAIGDQSELLVGVQCERCFGIARLR